jgi:molybdopterin-containing oxidoreductase family iron-sulfur binding subunit
MKIDRRKFLKLTGATGIGLGLSATDIFTKGTVEASSGHSRVSTAATRLAMVIDIGKLKTDDDYQRIIDACHSIHNVPTIDNPNHEVKWIWTDTYNHAFPEQINEYHPEAFTKKGFPNTTGYAPVYRMQVLYGGLSLRLKEL